MPGIYKIVCSKSESIYIGQTTRSFKRRLIEHKNECKPGGKRYCRALANAFDKHGPENFSLVILEEIDPGNGIDFFNERESHWIDFHIENGFTLYNIIGGGSNRLFTEEQRQRMSTAQKITKNDPTKNRGGAQTQESKDKISASLRGRKRSPEAMAKLRETISKRTQESKDASNEKRSKSLKKAFAEMKGTEKWRERSEKLSESKKGKKASDSHVFKRPGFASEMAKRRWDKSHSDFQPLD